MSRAMVKKPGKLSEEDLEGFYAAGFSKAQARQGARRMWTSGRLSRLVFHPGVDRDPVYFPGLAPIIRE
jgi:hypothetical protein